MVEFALLLLPLSVLVFGIVDLGRSYELQHRLTNAAREAGAVLAYSPAHLSCTDGKSAVERARAEDASFGTDARYRGIKVVRTPKGGGPGVTVYDEAIDGSSCDKVTGSKLAVSGDTLTVTGTYDFAVLTPLISKLTGNPIVMARSYSVRVQ